VVIKQIHKVDSIKWSANSNEDLELVTHVEDTKEQCFPLTQVVLVSAEITVDNYNDSLVSIMTTSALVSRDILFIPYSYFIDQVTRWVANLYSLRLSASWRTSTDSVGKVVWRIVPLNGRKMAAMASGLPLPITKSAEVPGFNDSVTSLTNF
jgi:hypothetical protein